MTQVTCKTTIFVPADAIWRVINDFGAACPYLAGIVTCTVEGEGTGARRTLTSVDGSTVVERLETLDKAAYRLIYALLTDTPFRNCLTMMTIYDKGPSQAELEWSATFEPDGIPANEAEQMLEGALMANCLALKQFLEC